MNKLINIRHLTNPSYSIYRSYAFKSDLKIKWNRPEKIPSIDPIKSGDLSTFEPVSPKTIIKKYSNSKELETADDNVKKLFSLEYNRRRNKTDHIVSGFIDNVKRHDLDYGSMESKLARMTGQIRALQEFLKEYPRDIRAKVTLKEIIDRRKKFLKFLRRWDYPRFEWILEKLDLVYKPPPAEFHWITRKESLQKLTDIHCEQIRSERLDAYRSALEAKQKVFLKEKIDKLKFIRQEQIECKVAVTVEEAEIAEAVSKLKLLEEKETPVVKRKK